MTIDQSRHTRGVMRAAAGYADTSVGDHILCAKFIWKLVRGTEHGLTVKCIQAFMPMLCVCVLERASTCTVRLHQNQHRARMQSLTQLVTASATLKCSLSVAGASLKSHHACKRPQLYKAKLRPARCTGRACRQALDRLDAGANLFAQIMSRSRWPFPVTFLIPGQAGGVRKDLLIPPAAGGVRKLLYSPCLL